MTDQQIFFAGMENYKQSFSLADIEPNIEFITHSAINHHHPSSLMMSHLIPFDTDHMHSQRKRKEMETRSSPQVSDDETRSKKSTRRGKQVKRKENEEGKASEVVHVRARRGQATDSHSLAERVRREKINERLRCLQDIVPGCYKSMGMSTMLDEIINYVQSLQNQVEFLSMKLSAASTFHDFNSEADDALEIMHKAKAFEGSKLHNGVSGGPPVQFAPLGYNL